jgi:hypothetical protein
MRFLVLLVSIIDQMAAQIANKHAAHSIEMSHMGAVTHLQQHITISNLSQNLTEYAAIWYNCPLPDASESC